MGFRTGGPDAAALPGHRAINYSLHRVLDVTFDENDRRDHGAESLAIIRHLTLDSLDKARPCMAVGRGRRRYFVAGSWIAETCSLIAERSTPRPERRATLASRVRVQRPSAYISSGWKRAL
jgi:hypothetical protein